MLELEVALESAAPGREPAWRTAVLAALAVLDEATNDEYANANNPDSLLSDIKRTQPRLRTRVRGLRTQYKQLRQAHRLDPLRARRPRRRGQRLRRHPSTPVLDTDCAATSARPRIRPHLRGLLRRVPRRTRRRTQPVTLFVGAVTLSRDRRESIRCSIRLHACAARSCMFAGFKLPELQATNLGPDRARLANRPSNYRRSRMARSIWSGTISFGQIEHFPHQDRG